MERALIKQGSGGFTLYLPKKWIDEKGLKAGDKINLEERGSALVIDSEVKGKKEIKLKLNSDNKQDIQAILTHVYRLGFEKIEISNIDSIKEIEETTSDLLLGFEVTEHEKGNCIIENISEPTDEKYEVILKRLFSLTQGSFDYLVEDFKDGKFNHMKDIEELRKQHNKFSLFCRRVLTKEKYEKNPVLNWELLTFLMHIEHGVYYLYKYCSNNSPKLSEKAIELAESLSGYYGLYSDAYLNKKREAVHRINSLKTKYQFGLCLEMLEKSKGKESVVLSYMRELFRLIQIGTSPILSEILEKNLSED